MNASVSTQPRSSPQHRFFEILRCASELGSQEGAQNIHSFLESQGFAVQGHPLDNSGWKAVSGVSI